MACPYLTGSPWLGVAAAAGAGAAFGLLHAAVCNLPRVNDVAVGIALFIFGTGLAFFLGKPFVQPQAARLPLLPLGGWSEVPAIRAALDVSPLFFAGIALAFAMRWACEHALGTHRARGRRQRGSGAHGGLPGEL